MRPTSCVYCGGPLPPPAVTGRPRSFCSAQCREANERYAYSQAREQRERKEQSERDALREKREADLARIAEQEYQRALAAGGDVAAEARWQRASVQTLDETGGRFELCQWALEPSGLPGACFNRTADVYCAKHTRQLEREQLRKQRAASEVRS